MVEDEGPERWAPTQSGGFEPLGMLPVCIRSMPYRSPAIPYRDGERGNLGQPRDGRSNLKESCEYGWVQSLEFYRIQHCEF